MKPFWLERIEDESRISGVGLVAEGVVFTNGWCAMTWLTEYTSIAFYQSIKEVEAIHGHAGNTRILIGKERRPPGG